MDTNLEKFFSQPVPFAYALCSIVFDADLQPIDIICQQINEHFAEVAGKPYNEVIEKPFRLDNFDLLAQVRNQIPPILFYHANTDRQYKVDVLRTAIDDDIWVVMVDITQQIQIHSLDYSRLKDKIQDTDEQYLRLVRSSNDPILLFGTGVFIECNDAVASFLGYKSKSEFLLLTPAQLSPEYQPDGELSSAKSLRMNSECVRKGYHRFEWIHLRADGSPIPVEVSLTSIMYQGEPILHCVWRDLTEQKQMEQEMRDQQERILQELSAPITQLWGDILLLPLVGGMNTKRAQSILSAALHRISTSQSKVFILDIAGVALVDTAVANHFIKLAKATKLMGCACIISGISPQVAQTMVELGIQIDEINTTSNLQSALQQALQLTGLRITA
jgi:PAS domain S-box-containing protein